MAKKFTGNREAWLHAVTDALRGEIQRRAGITVPAKIQLSCGFPSRAALARKNRRVGECWPSEPETPIFITPLMDDSLDVAQVLVHELLHAGLPAGTGHKAPFKRGADACDLGGKPTATVRTPEFDAWVEPIIKNIGQYPHKKLDAKSKPKKQGTRLLKLECPSCGYIIRTTAKWVEIAVPICGICDEDFIQP